MLLIKQNAMGLDRDRHAADHFHVIVPVILTVVWDQYKNSSP